jgi:hypothetical protein
MWGTDATGSSSDHTWKNFTPTKHASAKSRTQEDGKKNTHSCCFGAFKPSAFVCPGSAPIRPFQTVEVRSLKTRNCSRPRSLRGGRFRPYGPRGTA